MRSITPPRARWLASSATPATASALFGWLLDDVLVDLTGQRKACPPPAEALPLIREFAGTYARAVAAAPFEDVLGPLFLETVCRGDQRYRGQFFTPWHVARRLAEFAGPGETLLQMTSQGPCKNRVAPSGPMALAQYASGGLSSRISVILRVVYRIPQKYFSFLFKASSKSILPLSGICAAAPGTATGAAGRFGEPIH